MIKEDEKQFLRTLQKEGWAHIQQNGNYVSLPNRIMPRDIIEREAMNEKRAFYLLEKWESKGWYEYGTVIDGGWLTPEAMEVMI
jgi:hypothetical protein